MHFSLQTLGPFSRHRDGAMLGLLPLVGCLILAVVAPLQAQAPPSAGDFAYPTFSLANLQQDFDQFQNIINTQQPQLYTDRADLAAAFVSQRVLLRDRMNELEFYRVLSPLLRRLNCGHSRLNLSPVTLAAASTRWRQLPLTVKVIQGRLFVNKTLPPAAFLAGAELLAVNDRSSGDLIQQLYDNLPADGSNLTYKNYFINRGYGFSTYYYLLVDSADQFSVTYRSPTERNPLTTDLAGVVAGGLAPWRDPAPALVDGIGWSEFADDYALLAVTTFNLYDEAGRNRFFAFVDRFFAEVAARRTPNVILDLRGNGGGDPYCGAYLFSHLLARSQPYFAATSPLYADLKAPITITPAVDAFTGRLYTLIDGGCFSTTGHFCSLLKYHQIGRFIGEETGGSFACTAATQTIALTRSQLSFVYSTMAFTTAVSGLTPGRGIMPDYEVIPSIEDFLGNRDVVKEFALSLIRDPVAPPAITAAPRPHAIAAGGTAVLDVSASGSALTYQWNRNGAAVPGATSRQFVLSSCSLADAGDYTVTVVNPNGSVTSAAATLGVTSDTDVGRLINVSVRTTTGPGDQVLTVGFVTGGPGTTGTKDLLIRGLSPCLATFGVPNLLADTSVQVIAQGSTTIAAANDDWAGNAAVTRTSLAVGAFPLTDVASKDAALLTTVGTGPYSVKVIGNNNTSGTVLAEIYDTAPSSGSPTTPRLVNVSARAQVGGSNPLICGFVIAGATARTVLIRGIGPALRQFLGTTAMNDPKLEIFRQQEGRAVLIASNDDWSGNPRIAAIARMVGGFALTDPVGKDAAILVTLDPGAYTVHITSADGAGGIALAEVYAVP